MFAESKMPGTTWASQLAGALQTPPLVFVHEIVAPLKCDAVSERNRAKTQIRFINCTDLPFYLTARPSAVFGGFSPRQYFRGTSSQVERSRVVTRRPSI